MFSIKQLGEQFTQIKDYFFGQSHRFDMDALKNHLDFALGSEREVS